MGRAALNGHRKALKTALVQNLVKPPEPANSRQSSDSTAEINLKIWRVYPSGFAILEVEIRKRRKRFRLAPFLVSDSPPRDAFQQLKFKFLDKVDSKFACSIRQEGRLEGFRSFMRHLWNTVGGEPDPSRSEVLARDFRDELTQAFNNAQADWDAIDRELLKWAVPTLGGAIATGAFSLALPVAGFAVAGVGEIIQAEMKRREFRRKVPMSVFIDLERR